MGALAILQTAHDGLANRHQVAIWGVLDTLHLGQPVLRQRPSNNLWYYTYTDTRVTPEACGYVAAVASNLGDIPTTWFPPILPSLHVDVDALREQVRAFVAARYVPLPEDDPDNPSLNRWQDAITLNNGPAALLGASEVPSDWGVTPEPAPIEPGS
jgi:hypothetical protein